MIRSVPKITKESMLKLDLNNPLEIEAFKKTAMSLGLTETFSEGALRELRDMKKEASLQEESFMSHLRTELFKKASELGSSCPYTREEMLLFTETPENFQKAAMMEARTVWAGLEDSLLKSGYDKNFTTGMLKQAEEFSEAVGAVGGEGSLGGITSSLGEGLKKVYDTVKEQGGQAGQSIAEGAGGLADAAKGVGSALGTAGSSIMDTAKETAGRLQEQAGPATEQFKQNASKALSKGKDVFNNLTSSLTPEDDRHQIIPGMGNQYLGAAGGALLSALMGGQMGLTGPASWLVPLLGGAAGYHYLPKLMNMWKDQPGTGTKSISPGAAAYNQQNPIISKAVPAAPGGSMSPSGNLGALSPKTV